MTRRSRVLGFTAIALLLACAPDDEPPVALEVLPDGVDMAIIEMDHFLTRTGVRRARLRADTAHFRNDGEIHLRPVELIFYDEDGSELSVITGDYGVFNEMTENMEAHGNVVALDRRDDQRLETTRIRYEAEEDRLFGDEPFTLLRDDGRTELQGSAFETDPGLSSILMFDSSGRTQQTVRPAPPPAPDSGAATTDSIAVVNDSTGAAGSASDSARVVSADSVGGTVPDSGAVSVRPDSTGTGGATVDTTGVAPPDTMYVSR